MLIAITNRKLCKADFFRKIEQLANAGVDTIILREKDLNQEEYLQYLSKCMKICSIHGVVCVAHSFIECAKQLNCKALHLSFGSFIEHKSVVKEFNQVGVSVHSKQEALEAQRLGAHYVIYGHIFQTDCKQNLPPRGVKELKELCQNVSIPVYGIGGITPYNAPLVYKAGAEGVCVMSSFMHTQDTTALVKEYKRKDK